MGLASTKKIGIYAGSFDPVHNGHLAFARAALTAGLEKVFFLVEPRPRSKQGVRALEHRQAMVKLAVADNQQLGSIMLEQARFSPHETLPVLQNRFKGHKLVLLFGDDVVSHIADWPHIEELVSSVQLLIGVHHQNSLELQETFRAISEARGLYFDYQFVDPHSPVASSSRIRSTLRRQQVPAELPQVVHDYIKQHRLYASASRVSK